MDRMAHSGSPGGSGRKRRRRAHSVVAGRLRLPIVELKPGAFVVATERQPRLPGWVDIMQGETRLARRLVVCAWAEDGLVGYEFKQENLTGPISADHAPDAPED